MDETKLPLTEHLAEDARFPFPVGFLFSKRHYYGKVIRDRWLSPRQKVVDMAKHTVAGVRRRLPFKPQRGMLITLSGIDGSGKTTQAETLLDALGECDIAATRVWSRGASSPLTDAVIGRIQGPDEAQRSCAP